MKRLLLAALALGAATEAAASCGAAFCMVNTSWNTQGAWTDPGRASICASSTSTRISRGGQRQGRRRPDPRSTTTRSGPSTATGSPRSTTLRRQMGRSATLPLLDRDQSHIHNHRGAQLCDTWNYNQWATRACSAGASGRETRSAAARFFRRDFGLKLPTGTGRAERGRCSRRAHAAAGHGHHRYLLGGYFRRLLGSGSSWFADVLVPEAAQQPRQLQAGHARPTRRRLPMEVTDKLG